MESQRCITPCIRLRAVRFPYFMDSPPPKSRNLIVEGSGVKLCIVQRKKNRWKWRDFVYTDTLYEIARNLFIIL